MQIYITTISKYLIALITALYTFESFFIFKYKTKKQRQGICIRQKIWIFLVQFLCFANLFVVSEDYDYIFLYIFVQIFLVAALFLTIMIYEKINDLLLNNMCMFLSIGLVVLSRISYSKATKQCLIIFVSFILALFLPYCIKKINFLEKGTWFYGLSGLVLLSIVLILGKSTLGSKISISIFDISFQPSEFVKIIFVFFLAAALYKDTSFKRVCVSTFLAALQVIVLVVSRDLGSALIFFIAYLAILYIATKNYWYLIAGLIGGVASSIISYQLFNHVRIRVLAWQNPFAYIDKEGFQITQSLFALGSGSWFGMGLLQGNPTAIPLVDADFIFSAICEELGVIFGFCFILIMLSSFIMIMEIAMKQKNNFYKLICVGIGTIYIFQIFLTIGGGVKFIPLTGVTLPFVSYGGSSVLTSIVMFFIVIGIDLKMKEEGAKKIAKKNKPR